MIRTVQLAPFVQKQLRQVPAQVRTKLQGWVKAVVEQGLEDVRKIRGTATSRLLVG